MLYRRLMPNSHAMNEVSVLPVSARIESLRQNVCGLLFAGNVVQLDRVRSKLLPSVIIVHVNVSRLRMAHIPLRTTHRSYRGIQPFLTIFVLE